MASCCATKTSGVEPARSAAQADVDKMGDYLMQRYASRLPASFFQLDMTKIRVVTPAELKAAADSGYETPPPQLYFPPPEPTQAQAQEPKEDAAK